MVHDAAATGYQAQSDTYAQARPSYHPDIVDLLHSYLSGAVVEVGAGTGIATSALAQLGNEVIAVEPVKAMREKLAAAVPTATVMDGTAESLPVNDGSADAVLVAQAFHWFDHGPALNEIARVLTPGGVLATLWNVRDERVPWMAAYTAIVDQVSGDTPRYRDMTWRRVIESDARFELEHEQSQPNPQLSNVEHTLGRFLSTSFIASLNEAKRDALAAEIRALVADLGDTYDFPYITEVQIWRYR